MLQLALFIALALVALIATQAKPLDDYVWRTDENYGWVDTGVRIGGPSHMYTGYVLNMTSQRWLTDADFAESSDSKSIWWHYLVVIVPEEIKYTRNASLWITGGSVTDGFPSASDEDMMLSATLAVTTGTVTGALFQIPNQHITFASDPLQKRRSEDAIIAFTWDHYLAHPDQPEWLVRFPMVKASVRAMDAITDFAAKTFPEKNLQLDYYTVSGASKRGWTTWLVGAVDPARVKLIVPIVLDAINFQKVEHHQFRSYGGWSFALQDYTDMNIMARLDVPNMHLLSEQEDPYFFRERLTMPKLVVNAALDEFQQPDDTHYWWNDMPNPKHFIMTPNAEHSEITGILEILPAISQWIHTNLRQEPVPTFTWSINNSTGEIVATLDEHGVVHEAHVYWAYSCGQNAWDNNTLRRDFRVAMLDYPCTCGIYAEGYCGNLKSIWSKKLLEPTVVRGRRTYSALIEPPTDGRWVAFFIDIKYKRNALVPDSDKHYDEKGLFPHDLVGRLEFSTEVSVLPNTFPYPDCVDSTCDARLL